MHQPESYRSIRLQGDCRQHKDDAKLAYCICFFSMLIALLYLAGCRNAELEKDLVTVGMTLELESTQEADFQVFDDMQSDPSILRKIAGALALRHPEVQDFEPSQLIQMKEVPVTGELQLLTDVRPPELGLAVLHMWVNEVKARVDSDSSSKANMREFHQEQQDLETQRSKIVGQIHALKAELAAFSLCASREDWQRLKGFVEMTASMVELDTLGAWLTIDEMRQAGELDPTRRSTLMTVRDVIENNVLNLTPELKDRAQSESSLVATADAEPDLPTELQQLQTRLQQLINQNFGERHPAVASIRRRLVELDDLRSESPDLWVAKQQEPSSERFVSAESEAMEELMGWIESCGTQVGDNPMPEGDIDDLQIELKAVDDQLQSLEEHLTELSAAPSFRVNILHAHPRLNPVQKRSFRELQAEFFPAH